MAATHWTLAQTLQRRGITTHALIKASGLSKGTVYDIVNGKSQGITLETVDKLLSGLEQLTGQRMALDAVLDRTEPEDPYAHLFVDAKPYDHEEAKKLIPKWTSEEKAELDRSWAEMEAEKQERKARGSRRMEELEALFTDEAENDQDKSA